MKLHVDSKQECKARLTTNEKARLPKQYAPNYILY